MSDVRLAGADDEAGLATLCALAHSEQPDHPLNIIKSMAMIRKGLYRQGGLVGVIGPAQDIRAMIILMIDPIWYSDDYQLLELTNFVRQDARRSDYAKQMIEFAKKCADDLGLSLTIGVYSNIRTEAKIRLYRRQVQQIGAFFSYWPKKKIGG